MPVPPPLREYIKAARAEGIDAAIERKVVEKLDDPGVSRTDDSLTVTMKAGGELGDLKALLQKRGLNPDDWQVANVTVNEWESGAIIDGEWTTITLHQLKVSLKPSFNFVKPARLDGPTWERDGFGALAMSTRQRIVAQLPDQQAPYHDRGLHEMVCRWLQANAPTEVVLSGDLFDFPSVSKHRKNPKIQTTAQQSIDAGYEIIRDYQQATPWTQRWILVPGNHEVRLENFLLDRGAEEIVSLRRAGAPEEKPLLSLSHVARLDELGVEVMESPFSSYPHPRYAMTDDFDIWHGWMVRPESGASALATIRKTGRSGGVGHTHRAGIVSLNDMDRKLIGVEAGTLARIEGGLGYEVAPNWENAFAVYQIHEGGMVHPSLAYYRENTLVYNNQIYRQTAAGVSLVARC